MTAPPQEDRSGMVCTPTRVERIRSADRLKAAARLTSAQDIQQDNSPARQFLRAAARLPIDLTHFWASFEGDGDASRVREVCLLAPGSGRTAMAFTSQPATTEAVRDLAGVIDAACHGLKDQRLVQALLEPHEKSSRAALEAAGFLHVGELLYLRRPWTPPPATASSPWPDGVDVATWRPGDDEDVMRALERSYEETMDCPSLCGLRETADVLDSHRSTGEFDPNLWWIVRVNGEPSGTLLLNPCPGQGHTELVYLGLAPGTRGMGLGRRLLRTGLSALAQRRERTVTCAVDASNAPARRLYESEGFAPFAQRTALVRLCSPTSTH